MNFKNIVLLCMMLGLAACTDSRNAKRVLESNGYTQINLTGHRWFMCGDSDTYSTGFKAITTSGAHVSGAVCSGFLLKGSTIRFD